MARQDRATQGQQNSGFQIFLCRPNSQIQFLHPLGGPVLPGHDTVFCLRRSRRLRR